MVTLLLSTTARDDVPFNAVGRRCARVADRPVPCGAARRVAPHGGPSVQYLPDLVGAAGAAPEPPICVPAGVSTYHVPSLPCPLMSPADWSPMYS